MTSRYATSSPRTPGEIPVFTGQSGDGGNRTRESVPPYQDHPPATILKGWALALRDLCDQGAKLVSATLEGETGNVILTYRPGHGCKIVAAGQTLEIPEAALDEIGLVVA